MDIITLLPGRETNERGACVAHCNAEKLQQIATLDDTSCQTRVNNIGFKLTVSETLTLPSTTDTSIYIECHWLNCSAFGVSDNVRRAVICEIFRNDPCYTSSFPVKRFPSDSPWVGSIVGEFNQRLSWRPSTQVDGMLDVFLQLPGSWFESVGGLYYTLKLMSKLQSYGFIPSRQDWALTDMAKSFNLFNVVSAVSNRNFSGFRTFDIHLSGFQKTAINGLTVNCGSRESDSMTRFYETTVKHGYSSNRIELELHGVKCRNFWDYLLIIFNDQNNKRGSGFSKNIKDIQELSLLFAREISKYIIGSCDFVDKTNQWNNKSLKNCERFQWWQDFIDIIGDSLRIPGRSQKSILSTKGSWMRKAWARWLAKMAIGLGFDVLQDIIQSLSELGLNKLEALQLSESENLDIEILRRDGILAIFPDN